MKIVVLDGHVLNPGDNPWDPVSALGELTVYDRTPAKKIVDRAAEADVLLTNKTPLEAAVLAELPQAKYISMLATGYDNVDVEAAAKRGVPVSNVPGYGTESVAQFVMAALLELTRGVAAHDASVRAGDWMSSKDFSYLRTPQVELTGLTFGVLGFGSIGRRTAELAHAFGMHVLAYAPRPKPAPAYKPFAFVELEELFERSDAVSLHCPLTPDNKGFVNAGIISRMKPTAYLINTARGVLVNEADLAEALSAGRIAGAALDVLAKEPPTAYNPLLSIEHCIVTPHIAWASLTARKRLMRIAADNVRGFQQGRLQNVVNGVDSA